MNLREKELSTNTKTKKMENQPLPLWLNEYMHVGNWIIINGKNLSKRINVAIRIMAMENPFMRMKNIDQELFLSKRNIGPKSWDEFKAVRGY